MTVEARWLHSGTLRMFIPLSDSSIILSIMSPVRDLLGFVIVILRLDPLLAAARRGRFISLIIGGSTSAILFRPRCPWTDEKKKRHLYPR